MFCRKKALVCILIADSALSREPYRGNLICHGIDFGGRCRLILPILWPWWTNLTEWSTFSDLHVPWPHSWHYWPAWVSLAKSGPLWQTNLSTLYWRIDQTIPIIHAAAGISSPGRACRVGSENLKNYVKASIADLLDGEQLRQIYWPREPLDVK